MKPIVKELAVIGILGIVVPWVVFYGIANAGKDTLPTETGIPEQTASANEAKNDSLNQLVSLLHSDGSVEKISLDAYVTGVVLAEMPAEFETDALMAQAVAARTYTLKRNTGKGKHTQADVCTMASCCQAYMTKEEYLHRGGREEDYDTVASAVEATMGQVLLYEGELIEATYFSCSGGMTEDALAVWGSEIPYLIAQPSPGEETSSVYTQSVTISREELMDKLDVVEASEPLIGEIFYTDGGGVDTIKICGQEFTGTQLRSLLGLRSTAFAICAVGENVTITTKGYGHRVGLSQYGAEAMAAQGSTYEEILAYYYPGTQLATAGTD